MFNYTYYGFRPLINLSVSSSTSDIASDPAQSLYNRHYETLLGLTEPIRWTHSSLTPSAYGFVDWNKTKNIFTQQEVYNPDYEFANRYVPGVGGSLTFSDAETSILSFMPEAGTTATLAAEDRVNIGNYSVWKYMAQVQEYLRVADHSVLVPRAEFLGSSYESGYDDNSFAILQGKRLTDLSDVGTHASLSNLGIRGYSDEYIYTRRAMIGSLDFHFPLARIFSGLGGTFPGFLSQIHGFVFGETGFIPANIYHENYFLPSFGGGLNLDTTLLLDVPVSFTLQVQNGTNKDFGGDTIEFLGMTIGQLY